MPNPLLQALTTWTFDPGVVVLLVGAALLYLRTRPSTTGAGRDLAFTSAVVLALLALASPLDYLGDRYLFSAHMLQHLLLMLVVAPLLVVSIQGRAGWLDRLPSGLGWSAAALALFELAMWAWHAPALYEAALASPAVHAVQHLCFVATAVVFWAAALAPIRDDETHLRLAARIAYLLLAAFPSGLLGVLLTFAAPLYPTYAHAFATPIGLALSAQLGLTAAADQQLGGLLMWVPGGLAFLIAAVYVGLREVKPATPDAGARGAAIRMPGPAFEAAS